MQACMDPCLNGLLRVAGRDGFASVSSGEPELDRCRRPCLCLCKSQISEPSVCEGPSCSHEVQGLAIWILRLPVRPHPNPFTPASLQSVPASRPKQAHDASAPSQQLLGIVPLAGNLSAVWPAG